jgi:hypothetical protein
MGISMTGKRIYARAPIMKYFEEHVGVHLYADDIAKDLGITRRQVQSAISNMRLQGVEMALDIETIIAGSAWIYKPSGKEARESEMIIEILMVKEDNEAMLVRTEDGAVYKMTPVDF